MFNIYEGKPLSALSFNREPGLFKGGKSVYYVEDDVILNTTIVAGYASDRMFNEGHYGITNTGELIIEPMEMVDWNFNYVSEYLTKKYHKLFILDKSCLMAMNANPGQEYLTVATSLTDGVRLSEDRFIKYGALRVEHLDELAKAVELAMESKDEVADKANDSTIVSEANIVCVSNQRGPDKPFNKYYVKFHYIDGSGKEQKVETLVHWDTTSIQQLEASLKSHFGVQAEYFFEIDYISLINQVVNYG